MATGLIELSTARLVLRQWRDEDRAPFAAMNADPLVMEHFPEMLSRDQSDAMVDRCVEPRFGRELPTQNLGGRENQHHP